MAISAWHIKLLDDASEGDKCPECGSEYTHSPGPFKKFPLFDYEMGWRLCYSCGKTTQRLYPQNNQPLIE